MCSGIGVPELAWRDLPGWRPVYMAEIAAFPRAVLSARFGARCVRRAGTGDVALFSDLTAIRMRHLRRLGVALPELIVAGTPCQSFSMAGKGLSLADARGNLTVEFLRLVHATRNANPDFRWLVWENVPGILNKKDNPFGCFLGGLVDSREPVRSAYKGGKWPSAGMVAGPVGRAAWRVLDAQHFGVPQRRARVILVAGFGDRTDPAEILFEPARGGGGPAPGNEPGDCGAGTVEAGPGGGGGGSVMWCSDIAKTLTTGEGSSHDVHFGTFIVSEGEGIASACYGFSANDDLRDATADVSCPVRAGGTRGNAAIYAPSVGVRKLTPIEAERVQGLPDNHTQIAWRGKPVDQCPDGRRYHAIGNAMAEPVMRWIGERIQASEAR